MPEGMRQIKNRRDGVTGKQSPKGAGLPYKHGEAWERACVLYFLFSIGIVLYVVIVFYFWD